MATNMFFWIAFSFLLTHEMDAVRRHEWNIFPWLARLTNDERRYMLFTAMHVPLYILLLWGLFPNGSTVNQRVVIGLDIFCIIHILLHMLFNSHPNNQFNSRFSWALILGAGIAGSIDLLLRL